MRGQRTVRAVPGSTPSSSRREPPHCCLRESRWQFWRDLELGAGSDFANHGFGAPDRRKVAGLSESSETQAIGHTGPSDFGEVAHREPGQPMGVETTRKRRGGVGTRSPYYISQPGRYSRFSSPWALSLFLTCSFAPSHSSFWPARKATIPSRTLSVSAPE